MPNPTWYPIPLYLYTVGGELFVLPTERDFRNIEENIARLTRQRDAIKERLEADEGGAPQSSLIERINALTQLIEDRERELTWLREDIEKKRQVAEKRAYEFCQPPWGEFLAIEEKAKDWIDGVGVVNNSRLALDIMANRVRLDGQVLDAAAIKQLPYLEGYSLWKEIHPLLYPDPTRIPFLSSPS